MSPRRRHGRRNRRAFSYRIAAITVVVLGGALVTAHAATNHVGSSNLVHLTNLPGPPPQSTIETPSSPATDAPPVTSSPASDPSVSPPSSDPVPPPSDLAPSSTG